MRVRRGTFSNELGATHDPERVGLYERTVSAGEPSPENEWTGQEDELTIGVELAASPTGVRIYDGSPLPFSQVVEAMRAESTIAYGDTTLGVEHRDHDPYHALLRVQVVATDGLIFHVRSDVDDEVIGPLSYKDMHGDEPSSSVRFTTGDRLWVVLRVEDDMEKRERMLAREMPWSASGSIYSVEWWEHDRGALRLPIYVPHPAGSLVRWRRNQALVEVVDLGFGGTYDASQQQLIRAVLRKWVDGEDAPLSHPQR